MTDNRLCPFCNGYVIYLNEDPTTHKYYAECQDCFARGPLAQSGLTALDLWRSRETGRIATFPSRDAALPVATKYPDATAIYDYFPGEDIATWGVAVISEPNYVKYLRKDGTFK